MLAALGSYCTPGVKRVVAMRRCALSRAAQLGGAIKQDPASCVPSMGALPHPLPRHAFGREQGGRKFLGHRVLSATGEAAEETECP